MVLFEMLAKLGVDTSGFNGDVSKAVASVEGGTKQMGTAFKTVGDKLTGIGKKMSAVFTAPVIAAFTAGTKKSLDFEDGLAKVYTIADKTQVPMDEMRKSLIDLSNESGRSTGELTEGMYQALSASVDTKDAIEFLDDAVKLSKAGFLETGDAVDVLTTIMNAYGYEAESAEQISDQLIQTQNDGKTTVNELAASMGAIIPTAAAMNVPLEQLNASYALMTKQGIKTANATTYMSGMFTELSDNGSDVSKILKEKTGKSFGELMADGKSLGDVLQILMNHVGGNKEAFSNLWGNVRAGRGALALVNAGADQFNEETKKMQESSGKTAEALKTLDTPGAKLRKSMTRLSNSLLDLGDKMVPYVEKAANFIDKLVEKWNNMDGKTKDSIMNAALIIAAVGPVLIVLGKVFTVIGTIISVIGTVVSAIGGVISVVGAVLTALAPIAPIILGIIAVIAAVILVIKNWGAITEFLKKVWEELKTTAVEIWNGIASGVKAFLDSIKQSFVAIWNGIKTLVINVWNGIKTYIQTTLNNIKICIQGIFAAVKTIIGNAWNWIKTKIQTTINNIKSIVQTVFSNIKSTIENVINGIKSFVQSAWSAIKDHIITPVKDARDKVAEAFGSLKDKVKEKVSSVIENVKEKFKKVVDIIKSPFVKAKEKVEAVVEKLKDVFDFDWSLPHIDLPHISITGEFSIDPPSVPHFDIEWYKKAYTNPFLFNSGTVIPTASGLKGFGDGSGGEIVYSRNKLMNDIREATEGNGGVMNVVMNIYASEGQDVNELADIVIDKLSFKYSRQGSAFA